MTKYLARAVITDLFDGSIFGTRQAMSDVADAPMMEAFRRAQTEIWERLNKPESEVICKYSISVTVEAIEE